MSDLGYGVKLPWRFSDFLSGAYYALSITATLVGFVIYQVRSDAVRDGHLQELEKATTRLNEADNLTRQRINDIDSHGTRTMQVVQQRLEGFDTRMTELNVRIANTISAISELNKSTAVIETQMTNLTGAIAAHAPLIARGEKAMSDQVADQRDIKQLHDQQERIVQALDHLYSLITKQPESFQKRGR